MVCPDNSSADLMAIPVLPCRLGIVQFRQYLLSYSARAKACNPAESCYLCHTTACRFCRTGIRHDREWKTGWNASRIAT